MKALIIIPYYGQWPSYMQLFLTSCAGLKVLDFVILTDNSPLPTLPENVSIKRISLAEISTLIHQKLGLKPALDRPYKLCDFKSAYGQIFDHIILDYPYWGFGDIDLYYGSADKFLEPLFERKIDIISGRKYWISGALCLFRNTPVVNALFKRDEFYRNVFTDTNHYSFTECSKMWHVLLSGVAWYEINYPYPNLTSFVLQATLEKRVTSFFDDLIKESIPRGSHIHINHRVIQDHIGKEYLLFHYIMAKRNSCFTYPDWSKIPEEFFITETGFYTPQEFRSPIFPWKELRKKISTWPDEIFRFYLKVRNKLRSPR
ncbi:MAG: hypothetical protein RLO81_08900 [Fulvivirga sp.]|uniref:DUF6625 family protein n=1 Tax=Fulvivirga sp. TaxID=1931237 RepID=UPI0032F05A3C